MAAHPSRLMALPAELRLLIYELCFTREVVAISEPTDTLSTLHLDRSSYVSYIRSPTPGLLPVNRQLHAEAIPTYYGRTMFKIKPARAQDRDLGSMAEKCTTEILSFWLSRLPSKRTHQIQDIHVNWYSFDA